MNLSEWGDASRPSACETLRRKPVVTWQPRGKTDRGTLQELQTAVDSIEAEPQYKRLLATPGVPKRALRPAGQGVRGGASVPCQLSQTLCEENLGCGNCSACCVPGPGPLQ